MAPAIVPPKKAPVIPPNIPPIPAKNMDISPTPIIELRKPAMAPLPVPLAKIPATIPAINGPIIGINCNIIYNMKPTNTPNIIPIQRPPSS